MTTPQCRIASFSGAAIAAALELSQTCYDVSTHAANFFVTKFSAEMPCAAIQTAAIGIATGFGVGSAPHSAAVISL